MYFHSNIFHIKYLKYDIEIISATMDNLFYLILQTKFCICFYTSKLLRIYHNFILISEIKFDGPQLVYFHSNIFHIKYLKYDIEIISAIMDYLFYLILQTKFCICFYTSDFKLLIIIMTLYNYT